jgi:ribonuclease M5
LSLIKQQQRKIREVIVVEGRNDSAAVQRAVHADTIETRGSAVGEKVIAEVKRAQQNRGVIILTDPDAAGERIRRIISREVPGCKQAFIPQQQARGGNKVGVEHATSEAIREALESARFELEPTETGEPTISWERYMEAGLVGGEAARRRRRVIADQLGIGYGNARQFYRRLHLLRITLEEFEEALRRTERDEADD